MQGSLPFHPFFSDLRKQTGLSLAPAHLADLQRLMLEMRPQTPEDVLALCRMLWLQKAAASDTFDRLFWQHWEQLRMAFDRAMQKKEEDLPEREEVTPDKDDAKRLKDDRLSKDREEEIDDGAATEDKPVEKRPETEAMGKKTRNIWLHFGESTEKNKKTTGGAKKSGTDLLDHSFVFTPKYWPLPSRRLQQNWRYLRSERQKIFGHDIDMGATVAKLAAESVIEKPVYQLTYARRIQDVHVLLDHGGSMTPYAELSGYLVASILQALKPRRRKVLYFRNQPERKLYRDTGLFAGEPVGQWLRGLYKYSLVVIISDAGAIRGAQQPERVNKTRDFLAGVKLQTDRILWLNPLPRERWGISSAFFIDFHVTMVGAESKDLLQLAEILKKW